VTRVCWSFKSCLIQRTTGARDLFEDVRGGGGDAIDALIVCTTSGRSARGDVAIARHKCPDTLSSDTIDAEAPGINLTCSTPTMTCVLPLRATLNAVSTSLVGDAPMRTLVGSLRVNVRGLSVTTSVNPGAATVA